MPVTSTVKATFVLPGVTRDRVLHLWQVKLAFDRDFPRKQNRFSLIDNQGMRASLIWPCNEPVFTLSSSRSITVFPLKREIKRRDTMLRQRSRLWRLFELMPKYNSLGKVMHNSSRQRKPPVSHSDLNFKLENSLNVNNVVRSQWRKVFKAENGRQHFKADATDYHEMMMFSTRR